MALFLIFSAGVANGIDTADSITTRLQETFISFDDDQDGEINEWEFTQVCYQHRI